MIITALETFRPEFQPNLCVVRLSTDEGIVGLGEAFFQAPAVEAYLHSAIAPQLVGSPVASPEAAAMRLAPYVGFQGGGVELRGGGAIDFALWDLLGKRAGLPVAELLGGPVRDRVRAYNTCAGSGYVSGTSRQESSNWGVGRAAPYEDLQAFLTAPAALARDLRAEGYTGMKIWPFDMAAERSHGTEITASELRAALGIVEAVRTEVGDEMDLMIELHGLWNAPTAAKIAAALEQFAPYWIEDPVRPDSPSALAAVRDATSARIATGETVVGRRGFQPLLERGLVDVVTVDTQWTGGLTEARKVASLADAYGIPIAPHDCTGPITLAACTHLSLSQPNGFLQETTRSFRHTWYREVVEGGPVFVDGALTIDDTPGLGVRLVDGFESRPDVVRRATGQPA